MGLETLISPTKEDNEEPTKDYLSFDGMLDDQETQSHVINIGSGRKGKGRNKQAEVTSDSIPVARKKGARNKKNAGADRSPATGK